MLNAIATEEVPLSADAVWDVIGDFEHLRKWAPAVMSERTELTPEGKVRVLQMPPDGREVRELLTRSEQYSFTYKFLGEHPSAVNYHGTVSVVPIDAGRSRIELRSDFDAKPGLSDEDAVGAMTKGVKGFLKLMKRALKVE